MVLLGQARYVMDRIGPTLEGKSDVDERRYGLHETGVLAQVDKVFETLQVLRVPFSRVDVRVGDQAAR